MIDDDDDEEEEEEEEEGEEDDNRSLTVDLRSSSRKQQPNRTSTQPCKSSSFPALYMFALYEIRRRVV